MEVLWLAALALGSSAIVFAGEVQVASEIVALDDVADLTPLPTHLAERARTIEIARTGDRLTLSVQRVCERARAQIPALTAWLPADEANIIVERRASTAQVESRPSRAHACMRLAVSIEAGATPRASDFTAALCEETALQAFRYDRGARVLRATRRLDQGALVYAPPVTLLAGVRTGDALSVAVRTGPVVVERDVIVAAPARVKERVFVRTVDNQVFAIPHPERAP